MLQQQVYFDSLVNSTNCTSAPDRFECLKQAPFSALQNAVDATTPLSSYQSLRFAWSPVVDGMLIPRNPLQIVESGKIAKVSCVVVSLYQSSDNYFTKVPFITGDCEDEET